MSHFIIKAGGGVIKDQNECVHGSEEKISSVGVSS